MRGLEPDCADSAQPSKVSASADGLGAGLEPVEDLQGALVIGRYYSGRHSIKSRAEMFAAFRQAILFQQELGACALIQDLLSYSRVTTKGRLLQLIDAKAACDSDARNQACF